MNRGVSFLGFAVIGLIAAVVFLLVDTLQGTKALAAVALFLALLYGIDARQRLVPLEGAADHKEDSNAETMDELEALRNRVQCLEDSLEQALDELRESREGLQAAQDTLNTARQVVEEAQQDMVTAAHELQRARHALTA